MPFDTFIWYELMTSDTKAARAFYGEVVGWHAEAFGLTGDYTLLGPPGADKVAGLMPLPPEVSAAGGRPMWLGYVAVRDVDARAAAIEEAGGAIRRAPFDIPEVGRVAVVADPQGATFMLIQPAMPDRPAPPLGEQGRVGWHELYADDWRTALDFYAGQFGWAKDRAVDMGQMGTYQLFAASPGGEAIGGMMNRMEFVPMPFWQFYFTVDGVEAAAARVTGAGGQVMMGPHEVPGGMWIANCMDPQGAAFSLVSARR